MYGRAHTILSDLRHLADMSLVGPWIGDNLGQGSPTWGPGATCSSFIPSLWLPGLKKKDNNLIKYKTS